MLNSVDNYLGFIETLRTADNLFLELNEIPEIVKTLLYCLMEDENG